MHRLVFDRLAIRQRAEAKNPQRSTRRPATEWSGVGLAALRRVAKVGERVAAAGPPKNFYYMSAMLTFVIAALVGIGAVCHAIGNKHTVYRE
jgi:hypothetical protein